MSSDSLNCPNCGHDNPRPASDLIWCDDCNEIYRLAEVRG